MLNQRILNPGMVLLLMLFCHFMEDQTAQGKMQFTSLCADVPLCLSVCLPVSSNLSSPKTPSDDLTKLRLHSENTAKSQGAQRDLLLSNHT